MAFHVLTALVIIFTRQYITLQAVIGTGLVALVLSAEWLNEQAALQWRCV